MRAAIRAASMGDSSAGYDVIAVAGQSNSVGYTGPVVTTEENPGVFRYVFPGTVDVRLTALAGIISPFGDPLGHADTIVTVANNGVGPAGRFAKLYKATTSRKVLIVPTGQSSTGLVRTFQTWNPSVIGGCLDRSITLINDAIALGGPGSRLVAVLWVQGESDAQEGRTEAAYQAKLDELISAFRTRPNTATSSLPFVIGPMVPGWTTSTAADGGSIPGASGPAIAAAHASTPGRVSRTAYGVGATGAGAGLHYNETQARTLGSFMFSAFQSIA